MRQVLVTIVLCALAVPARAQYLGVAADRFTIDGRPAFLTFISYFGAMGAPDVDADLRFLKDMGFDGVRIWPNLDTGPQLMNGDGTLRPEGLRRLQSILERARANRLVVDVTFTYEHVAGMTPATARRGIAAAAEALRPCDNVLFDIQNEWNVRDRRYMSETDVARIVDAIRQADPSRIVTADTSGRDDAAARAAAESARRLGLDVSAFHESRGQDWYTLAAHQRVIAALKSGSRPVYLQEPNRARDRRYRANDRADYFFQARANARAAGAAAWCFHTPEGFDFRTGPARLEERLRAHPEPEWAFVTGLQEAHLKKER